MGTIGAHTVVGLQQAGHFSPSNIYIIFLIVFGSRLVLRVTIPQYELESYHNNDILCKKNLSYGYTSYIFFIQIYTIGARTVFL